MTDFRYWDYESFWINEETNKNIDQLFKSDSKKTKEFIQFLKKEKVDFLISKRDLIFVRLIFYNHHNIAEELIEEKYFRLDETIFKEFSFSLGLKFDKDVFDYFLKKLKEFNLENNKKILTNFWENFLLYQFIKIEEVQENIKNLQYVINKIPFYVDNSEIINKYLIESRKQSLKHQYDNLKYNNQETKIIVNDLLKTLTINIAKKYPQHEIDFYEEFQNFPEYCEIFHKLVLKNKLDDQLLEKKKIGFNKI